ncbi:MAG TPA: transglycosylase SLT domain-containing protein [Flavobacteriaceae bacterium]|nr:transglycosylase SLT domain-containing protein [Flavobacteriaceae bacterium]
MKQIPIFFFLVFTAFLSVAQQSYQDKLSLLKEIEADLARKRITWETKKEIILNDSISFTIQDVVQAKEIDSLWLAFLFDSGRYDEMYKTVTEETFEEVEYHELPTELLKERLEALNARTPFQIEYNPKLESVIKQYLKYRKRGLTRIIGLSKYYFPMFEEVLDKHNLPLELKYLAVVESALDPRAKSPAGASGLWQFMYQTGRAFDLKSNSYVDDRNDPVLSTEAASEYLSYLHGLFDDWDLALAAYNSGPGNVSKAIRRSGGSRNYWNIRPFLPRETANYVPAFLATMYIFEYADEHGLYTNGPTTPVIATDTIHIKETISFEQINKVTDIPIKELQYLNPSYKLGVIPYAKDRPYALRLPLEAVGTFVANEESVYAYAKAEFEQKEKPNPDLLKDNERISYRVKSGDYLGKIAQRYRVSVNQIKQWNGLRNNNLRIGQVLVIFPRL